MGKSFTKLFEPVRIGQVTVKNRLAMAPLVILGMTHPNGSPAQRAVDFYLERARGGVGLIISSAFKVENEIDVAASGMPLITKAVLSPLGELCDALHSLGTKIFIQLTAGLGRVGRSLYIADKPVSASAVPYYWDPHITCRPLSVGEIGRIIQAFGIAAEIVSAAGADGIEIHGHEGYLLDQFNTAIWNQRKDQYGGNLKKRLTFSLEILKEIRKKTGPFFPVTYRFSLKHFMKGLNAGALDGEDYQEVGRDVEEGLQMAKLLEIAGYDGLHVDAGCYDSWYWAHPPTYMAHGCTADLAAKVKTAVKIPVIAVGRMEIPELAEKTVSEEKADMVALGRGLLADPEWPNKVREGRLTDIRPCLGCGDGCSARLHAGKPMSCAVNPACGRERTYQLSPAEKPKKVMVVGGGVAGMEAARVAAIRKHRVILYEKSKKLGGHVIAASVPGFKKDLEKLIDWYAGQLKQMKVKVELGKEVTPTLVNQEKPEVILLATGSKSAIPNLPGIENPRVVTCIDLLTGKKKAESEAVVVGGGLVGCETALWLARQGKKTTLVETLPRLMAMGVPVPRMNAMYLQDSLAFYKVSVLTETTAKAVTDKGLIVTDRDSNEQTIKADTVVLAVGFKADDKLYEMLRNKVARLYKIGDCRNPLNVMNAVWDGYEVGRAI